MFLYIIFNLLVLIICYQLVLYTVNKRLAKIEKLLLGLQCIYDGNNKTNNSCT